MQVRGLAFDEHNEYYTPRGHTEGAQSKFELLFLFGIATPKLNNNTLPGSPILIETTEFCDFVHPV